MRFRSAVALSLLVFVTVVWLYAMKVVVYRISEGSTVAILEGAFLGLFFVLFVGVFLELAGKNLRCGS